MQVLHFYMHHLNPNFHYELNIIRTLNVRFLLHLIFWDNQLLSPNSCLHRSPHRRKLPSSGILLYPLSLRLFNSILQLRQLFVLLLPYPADFHFWEQLQLRNEPILPKYWMLWLNQWNSLFFLTNQWFYRALVLY